MHACGLISSENRCTVKAILFGTEHNVVTDQLKREICQERRYLKPAWAKPDTQKQRHYLCRLKATIVAS